MFYFWGKCAAIIPESLKHADKSQQFFDVTLCLFRAIDHVNRERLELDKFIQEWSDLLLKHIHTEVCRIISSSNISLTMDSLLVEKALIGLSGAYQDSCTGAFS